MYGLLVLFFRIRLHILLFILIRILMFVVLFTSVSKVVYVLVHALLLILVMRVLLVIQACTSTFAFYWLCLILFILRLYIYTCWFLFCVDLKIFIHLNMILCFLYLYTYIHTSSYHEKYSFTPTKLTWFFSRLKARSSSCRSSLVQRACTTCLIKNIYIYIHISRIKQTNLYNLTSGLWPKRVWFHWTDDRRR